MSSFSYWNLDLDTACLPAIILPSIRMRKEKDNFKMSHLRGEYLDIISHLLPTYHSQLNLLFVFIPDSRNMMSCKKPPLSLCVQTSFLPCFAVRITKWPQFLQLSSFS